jgi:hypothetical protein
MFADEIRRAIEASSRITLPAVTALLWRAYGEGKVTEAEAEALSVLIEARTTVTVSSGHSVAGQASNPTRTLSVVIGDIPSDRQRRPRTGVGSRPRSDASLERRRRWAASGRLPPALAARFTLAEQAALSLVAAESARRGDCRLSIEHIAALAGVSRSTVKSAIREARRFGLLTVEERKVRSWRNDTNVVRIVSPEWQAWLRLARREDRTGKRVAVQIVHQGGGVKFAPTTPTQVSNPGKTGIAGLTRGRFAGAGRVS